MSAGPLRVMTSMMFSGIGHRASGIGHRQWPDESMELVTTRGPPARTAATASFSPGRSCSVRSRRGHHQVIGDTQTRKRIAQRCKVHFVRGDPGVAQ